MKGKIVYKTLNIFQVEVYLAATSATNSERRPPLPSKARAASAVGETLC